MSSELLTKISAALKSAMVAKDTVTLATIRLLLAAIKKEEIDKQQSLDDDQIITIIDKMVRQRREAIVQFQQANRQDLVDKEQAEIEILKKYLPPPLTEAELSTLIDESINSLNATTVKDMSKVLAKLRPQIQGKADIGQVSLEVKKRLST